VRAAVAFALVFSVFLSPRLSAQPPPLDPRQAAFSLYAHAFLDSERKPTVAVNVNIPYSSLIFLRNGAAFQSEYAAYIKILDKKNRLVDTAVINEAAVAENYEATRSAKMSAKSSVRFGLAPGDYLIECTVEVKNTLRVFEKSVPVTVPEFPKVGLALGKPRLYAVAVDTSASVPVLFESPTSGAFGEEEHEGTLFAELDRHPAVRFEVYAQEETSDSMTGELYFEVLDDKKTVHAYGRRNVTIAGLRNDFVVYLDIDEWDPGPYVFVAKALEGDPVRQTTESLDFVLGYTATMLTRHFERTVGILALIATPEEIGEIKNAPEAERVRLWGAFWAKRDPSPGTGQNEALTEHLRRVRHAVDHYPDGGAGWQSDRGKVYIKYGEPDHTEVRIDAQYQGEYLLWYYYKESLTFVFYDRMGLGEYRLTDSSQL